MSKDKLNRSEDFAAVCGSSDGRAFEQNGKFYTGDGSPWIDPDAPVKKLTPAEQKAADKAEADRIEQEQKDAEAAKKTAAEGSSQADQQLNA